MKNITNLEKANAIYKETFGVENRFGVSSCPYPSGYHVCLNCSFITNGKCEAKQWWKQSYNGKLELETDWSKVPVDTLIIVGYSGCEEEYKRYFARYENSVVYAWAGGKTSVTADDMMDVTSWEVARLAE